MHSITVNKRELSSLSKRLTMYQNLTITRPQGKWVWCIHVSHFAPHNKPQLLMHKEHFSEKVSSGNGIKTFQLISICLQTLDAAVLRFQLEIHDLVYEQCKTANFTRWVKFEMLGLRFSLEIFVWPPCFLLCQGLRPIRNESKGVVPDRLRIASRTLKGIFTVFYHFNCFPLGPGLCPARRTRGTLTGQSSNRL